MTGNYAKIVRDNLNRLDSNLPKDLAKKLPAEQEGERFFFYCLPPAENSTMLYFFYEADDDFTAPATCLFSETPISLCQ